MLAGGSGWVGDKEPAAPWASVLRGLDGDDDVQLSGPLGLRLLATGGAQPPVACSNPYLGIRAALPPAPLRRLPPPPCACC